MGALDGHNPDGGGHTNPPESCRCNRPRAAAAYLDPERRLAELTGDLNRAAQPDGRVTLDRSTLHGMLRDLAGCYRAQLDAMTRDAFHDGMALGARVEHENAVRALQQAALQVLGKDRGDGAINLGALGTQVYAD